MFGSLVFTLLISSLLYSGASALYNFPSNVNLAMYWVGADRSQRQGPDQLDLQHYCRQSDIDFIPIGFLNVYPPQGNGYPGTNFGDKCMSGVYAALDTTNTRVPAKTRFNLNVPVSMSTFLSARKHWERR